VQRQSLGGRLETSYFDFIFTRFFGSEGFLPAAAAFIIFVSEIVLPGHGLQPGVCALIKISIRTGCPVGPDHDARPGPDVALAPVTGHDPYHAYSRI